MLPEFPRASNAIQKVWNRILFNAAGFSDPLVSQVAIRVQREGHRAFVGEFETEYRAHQVSHEWKPEVGKGISTDEFFGIPQRLGKEIAMGQAEIIFAAMSKPSPHVGTIEESDGPLTFELWLEKMEKYELDFDESDKPRWPQWFAPEAVIAEFWSQINQGALTTEQTQRLAELVAGKRKEFDEREDRRRLVD